MFKGKVGFDAFINSATKGKMIHGDLAKKKLL
jgi:hypothetical protein